MYNKHGHENRYKLNKALRQYGTKALRRFSSLAAWKHFQKSRSLEVWKSGGLKRRLSWDFACADFINPLSCQASRLPNFGKSLAAFTMAEILISLTIIGVIAAITLPSLRANINESAWATQRKALYSRMSQAISMMPSLNGYGQYSGTWNSNGNVTVTSDTAAATFVTEGLAKVMQINSICTVPANETSENARKELKKCGIPDKFKTMSNSKKDFPTKLSELNAYFITQIGQFSYPQKHVNTQAAAFTTNNGESVAVFYNPLCQPDKYVEDFHLMAGFMCADFIYDLNGLKGPNKFGDDIGFITALFPTDSEVVAPVILKRNAAQAVGDRAAAACRALDKNSRLPNRYEAMAINYNTNLAGNIFTDSGDGYVFWTSTIKNNMRYVQYASAGLGFYHVNSWTINVRCVER